MSLRVAILGASDAVGNMLAARLLRETLLAPNGSLMLVGHGTSSGQVKLAGEALGIDGVCGVPITLAREGWRPRDLACLNGRGRQAVVESAKSISAFLDELGVGRTRIITTADKVAA